MYFFTELVHNIYNVFAHKDYVLVLLFIIFKFLEQLSACKWDIFGELRKQNRRVYWKFPYLIHSLNIFLQFLLQNSVKYNAFLHKNISHLSGRFYNQTF